MPVDVEKAKQALVAERASLVHQLSELGAGETGDLNIDLDFGENFADAAAVTAERTEVLGVVESLKNQVEDIDKAMAQIELGKYGYCVDCGREISADRLEIRPMSIRCIDCKNKLSV